LFGPCGVPPLAVGGLFITLFCLRVPGKSIVGISES
jgi:hypothetical protein